MAARRAAPHDRPRLTILQLDTHFARIPGDVACPDSYAAAIEILRVPATVRDVVHDAPEDIDIAPFEDALQRARGDVITTSCGFLAPWQDHLCSLVDRPVLASVLNGPPVADALVMTYDAAALGPAHLYGWGDAAIVGLSRGLHLRDVIGRNAPLSFARAEAEVVSLGHVALRDRSAIVLECTNLPPYAPALRMGLERPVHHILTALEALSPGLVRPAYLTAS
ncbi:hypothetical protein [Jannaschia sp. LMIT008]|uniref:hypothetical protein n=1 Tax=Jannaschia maritima TaxID=3032585 RepID=UPI002812398B|nr:hypothetical protein [Jannaschia sp. LMIT008]